MATANYVLLERIELAASAASVTFTNIPQTGYTDLKIVMSIRGDNTANYGSVLFNNSSTGYTRKILYGNGSSVASTSPTGYESLSINPSDATSNTFENYEMYIPNYTSSNYKSFSVDAVGENNGTTAQAIFHAGLWSNSAAITSIVIQPTGNFVANSTFSLYGLAAVGTTPTIAPKASGGNITTDGTYWIHTFVSTGAFVPQVGLTCDALIVAGGGGGGYSSNDRGAGGGGAGGYRTGTGLSFASGTNYTVIVGAGGAGAPNTATAKGGNGAASSLVSILTTGGGGGGSALNATGASGGSGGGAANTSGSGTNAAGVGNAGSYSPVEGYDGGSAIQNNDGYNGGGGGGSSSAGSAASGYDSTGSAGGSGTANSITGTSVTYAAGGRGAGATVARAANSGAASTGNGGEGNANNYATANGGSGVVIIRYPIA